jgi:large subunit ribosomal protein L22
MKAILSNYRQSPRKVALVAGLIRGKKVSDAMSAVRFAVKRASNPIEKLLNSAIANAKNMGVENPMDLFVTEIRVDKGIVLKRFMPRARGSSAQILKQSSHIYLTLGASASHGNKPVKGKQTDANKVGIAEAHSEAADKKTAKTVAKKASKVAKAESKAPGLAQTKAPKTKKVTK